MHAKLCFGITKFYSGEAGDLSEKRIYFQCLDGTSNNITSCLMLDDDQSGDLRTKVE